ncbi:hypothetical protein CASFOL_034027 [Castilleja foliolosa]|uniref:C2 domain-containing protein n=1 Tax=Castilleja foliolosa TaxID=1961234 RepID=A0ABD3C0C0_9LAMI
MSKKEANSGESSHNGDGTTLNPQSRYLLEALRAELGKLITTEMEAVHERLNAIEERHQRDNAGHRKGGGHRESRGGNYHANGRQRDFNFEEEDFEDDEVDERRHGWRDRRVIHDGFTNKYSFEYNQKKVSLVPLTPKQVYEDQVQMQKETKKLKSKEQPVHKIENNTWIQKSFLANTGDLKQAVKEGRPMFVMPCKENLIITNDLPSLPPSISFVLQEFDVVFPDDTPAGLPPIRRIEHQINFVPGATLPNRPTYRTNQGETKELEGQISDLLAKGHVRENLSHCAVPVLLIPKKDGSMRLCCDCRSINNITQIHDKARENIERRTKQYAEQANKGRRKVFDPGDWVFRGFGISILLTNQRDNHPRLCVVHRPRVAASIRIGVLSVKLDAWTDEQVDALIEMGGNDAVNLKYEAHIPENISKPKPDSSTDERADFIRKKYELQQFMNKDIDFSCPFPPPSSSSHCPSSVGFSQSTPEMKHYKKQTTRNRTHDFGHGFRYSWRKQEHKPTRKSKSMAGMVEFVGLIYVNIVKGTNLAVRDMVSSDPYVILSLGDQSMRTRVIKNNLNPVWNERIMLSIPDTVPPLKLFVYDKDTFSTDDFMGDAEIDIQPLLSVAKLSECSSTDEQMELGDEEDSDEEKTVLDDRVVTLEDGRVKQNFAIKLKNVERGVLEIELECVLLS